MVFKILLLGLIMKLCILKFCLLDFIRIGNDETSILDKNFKIFFTRVIRDWNWGIVSDAAQVTSTESYI